jgi:hypothetical protein
MDENSPAFYEPAVHTAYIIPEALLRIISDRDDTHTQQAQKGGPKTAARNVCGRNTGWLGMLGPFLQLLQLMLVSGSGSDAAYGARRHKSLANPNGLQPAESQAGCKSQGWSDEEHERRCTKATNDCTLHVRCLQVTEGDAVSREVMHSCWQYGAACLLQGH